MFTRIHLSSRLLLIALVGYWTLMFVGTHLPDASIKSDFDLDKIAHFTAYAGLALLAALFFHSPKRSVIRLSAIVLVSVAAYGAVDEWSQLPIPRRHADVMDWLADIAGACMGVVAFCAIRARRPKTNHDQTP